MSFDDDFLGAVFPTRWGGTTGTANERQMLDKTGVDGFHKTYRTLPDGSQVRCETKDGMPRFIRSNGVSSASLGCSLEMDSGIIDLISLNENSSDIASPGRVYHTDFLSSAVAGSEQSIGTGKIYYPSLIGPVIANGSEAKAFRGSYAGATGYIDRKKIAGAIPPSVFTGRMRLYVQSLYGGTWSELMLADVSYGGRPVISINTVARDGNGLTPTHIGSGCGLYLDTATKKHYMIVLDTSDGFVIPLAASTCAEKYRVLLLSETISVDDAEKIEAYILSQSIPVPELAKQITFEETPNEAMGYSWHFNWDGNACDIIDVQEVSLDDSGETIYGFTSTHYHLDFSISDAGATVSRSVVSSESWSCGKNTNVIAYPSWGDRRLTKAGNLPSKVMVAPKSGKIYCFYDRNELRVLTVNTSTIDGRKSRESSPEYFGGKSYAYPTCYLRETESGFSYGEKVSTGKKIEFSIDGTTVGGESKNSTISAITATWFGRRALTECLGNGYDSDTNSSTIAEGETNSIDINMPDLSYSFDGIGRITGMSATYQDKLIIYGPCYATYTRLFFGGVWTYVHDTYTLSQGVSTFVVVPFNDAEAVFLSQKITLSKTGSKRTTMGSFLSTGQRSISSVRNSVVTDYGTVTTFGLTAFPLADRYAPYGDGVTTGISESTVSHDNSVVSISGTFAVEAMPGEDYAYSTADYIPQTYATTSSINGAIVSPTTGVATGADKFPANMTYSGWV